MIEKYTNQEIEDIYRLHLMLRQTNDINYKLREHELKEYNITPEQSSTLICINALGHKATPAELSRWLFREPHSILIILRRMKKLGLVEMKPHPDNKHMFRITLTKTGQEAYLNSVIFRAPIDLFSTISKEERQYLRYILNRIRNRGGQLLKLDLSDMDKLAASFKLPDTDTKKRDPFSKRK